jgi:hypothetical protein
MDLDEFMARSNARARRGRRVARQLFAVPVLLVASLLFIYLNQPSFMYEAPPNTLSAILFGVAVMIFVVGLAWMVRILRAHAEPDAGSWRYRER